MLRTTSGITFKDLNLFLFVPFSTILNAYINYRNQVMNEKMIADLKNLISQSNEKFEKMFSIILNRLDKLDESKNVSDFDSILNIITTFVYGNPGITAGGIAVVVSGFICYYHGATILFVIKCFIKFLGEEKPVRGRPYMEFHWRVPNEYDPTNEVNSPVIYEVIGDNFRVISEKVDLPADKAKAIWTICDKLIKESYNQI